jgi:hypothetical protein
MTLKTLLVATVMASVTCLVNPIEVWAAASTLKSGIDVKEIQQVSVLGVKIDNFSGTVNVKSMGTGDQVRVLLQGSDELLQQILVSTDHGDDRGKLYVGFEKEVPTLQDMDKVILTLEMPATMPLNLNLNGGKASIGDRDTNETKINLTGFGDINISSLKNLDSSISGSGEITIKKIQGNAGISIKGDGKYTINSGMIDRLIASIQGTGLIEIKADVKDADLSSEGAGNITIATVSGNLKQSMSGAGSISVAKIDGSMKNSINGSSQLEMSCSKRSKK